MVELNGRERELKYMIKEMKEKLDKVHNRKKEICPHTSLFLYGRVEEDNDFGWLVDVSDAKMKCKICGKEWDESEDDFEEMEELVENAKEVYGSWEN